MGPAPPRRDDTITLALREAGDGVRIPTVASKNSAHRRFCLTFGAREFLLNAGETVVGRGPAAEIVIDSRAVSHRHAKITIEGDRAAIQDLGSKNGTFVNGVRVGLDNGMEILNGYSIRLGPIWLTFRSLTGE